MHRSNTPERVYISDAASGSALAGASAPADDHTRPAAAP
jgi:hypothetical protein